MSSTIPICLEYQGILANYKPPWTRATLKCQDLQGSGIGVSDLDLRRKAQILQYNRNQNNLTKKQLWAMLNKGQLTRKKVWATQGINYTNPNVNNLNFANNNQNTNILQCGAALAQPLIVKNSSTASNVPGNPIELYLDPNVPLTNYQVQRAYPSGGSKFFEASWQPGDEGFPVGKAGQNP
jgi:hypothetical protein